MTEYELCKAVEEGHARKVPHASGNLFVCYSKECPMDYKILGRLCKADGLIPVKALKRSLAHYLVQIAQDAPRTSIN